MSLPKSTDFTNKTQVKALGRASTPEDKESAQSVHCSPSQSHTLAAPVPAQTVCSLPGACLERQVTAVKISDNKKSKNGKLADLNILHSNLNLFFSGWSEITVSPLLLSLPYCLSHAHVIMPVNNKNKFLCY